MFGETPRFRPGQRVLLGAALILAVTAALRGGTVLTNGAEAVPPVPEHVADPPGEIVAAATEAPTSAAPATPVAEPVAPASPPAASTPAQPTVPPQAFRGAEAPPSPSPSPSPWVPSQGPLPAAAPVRVEINAVGITAPIVPLGLNRDETLEVPRVFSQAGWYTGRPTPGETGPAIIVAHRSSRRGPGAFWHLPEVQPGQEIVVSRADGSRVVFVVDRIEQHPKSAFPTEAVYGPTPETALRLITCGGPFEPSLGDRYRDNIIVFARMTGTAA